MVTVLIIIFGLAFTAVYISLVLLSMSYKELKDLEHDQASEDALQRIFQGQEFPQLPE